jgi:hypothetical protein
MAVSSESPKSNSRMKTITGGISMNTLIRVEPGNLLSCAISRTRQAGLFPH